MGIDRGGLDLLVDVGEMEARFIYAVFHWTAANDVDLVKKEAYVFVCYG
jgi:hypothetical protein